MTYQFDYSAVFDNFDALLLGCVATLAMSIAAMILALAIALTAVIGLWPRWFRIPVGGFVELVRNTPFLVQTFFIYFGLPALGIRLPPDLAAVVALSVNGAAWIGQPLPDLPASLEGVPFTVS